MSLTKKFLLAKLDELEDMRKEIAEVKKEEIIYQVENFLLAVFMKLEQREKDLLSRREEEGGQDAYQKEVDELFRDYYRCSHFI